MSGGAMSGAASVRFGVSLRAALAAVCVALGACAGLAPAAPSLYTLTPRSAVDPVTPRANWQLLVEAPVASSGIDTPRIAVARSPTALDYFADVSWADRAPNLIQGLIVQSFEDSGRIVSVGRDSVGLRSDFLLKTDLRDFQAEFAAPGDGFPARVHVRIAAKLVDTTRRAIEAGEVFEAVVPVRGKTFPDVVAAFNEALGAVESRLVEWTLRTGSAVARAQGGTAGNGRTG